VSVLAEDCLLTMQPAPLAYRGRDAIGAYFATVPAGGDLTAIRLIPIQANGQPAVAPTCATAPPHAPTHNA
jgi:hypothetical protein